MDGMMWWGVGVGGRFGEREPSLGLKGQRLVKGEAVISGKSS